MTKIHIEHFVRRKGLALEATMIKQDVIEFSLKLAIAKCAGLEINFHELCVAISTSLESCSLVNRLPQVGF